MNRRHFLKALGSATVLGPKLAHATAPAPPPPLRLAFGSCVLQDQAQPMWRTIAAANPDAFVFIGDAIYADTSDMSVMESKYQQMNANPDFAAFRRQMQSNIYGTWDDHDFGGNDYGGDFAMKAESQLHFLKFLNEPRNSPRWSRNGVYISYFFGEAPHRTQLILLDMRWFRSPLRDDVNPTTYLPDYDPSKTFLGKEQWTWLQNELMRPADVRIIASSIQFLNTDHRFEKWSNFPLEKLRLLNMMDVLNLKNTFIVSGDVHFGEITRGYTPRGREVIDFTTSGINRFQSAKYLPNSKRFGLYDQGPNFGMVTVDWAQRQTRLELMQLDGTPAFTHTMPIVEAGSI